MKTSAPVSISAHLIGFLIIGLGYTAIGFLAGFLWAGIAPAFSLSVPDIATLLKIWWLWLLLCLPPSMLTGSMIITGVEPYLKKIVEAKRST